MGDTVVLTLGGCIDAEITLSPDVLDQLVHQFGIRVTELDARRDVLTERDLLVSILAHLRDGGGGEHHVVSPEVIDAFAARFPVRLTLGGTAVRAGVFLASRGIPSTLYLVGMNRRIGELLSELCSYISSGDDESFHPHLVVQFSTGESVTIQGEQICAPAANRLIYVNDPDNSTLRIEESLGDLLADAAILLISGFNAMRDRDELVARLRTLRNHLRRLPDSAVVILEDAAYHLPHFRSLVLQELCPRLDIFSLNQDELEEHVGRPVDVADAADVSHAISALRRRMPVPTILVHTSHWAAAFGDNGASYAEAVESGINAATTRYLHGDSATPVQFAEVAAAPRDRAAMALAVELDRRLPGSASRPGVAVSTTTPTTIGLGDTFIGGFLAALYQGGRSWS